MTIPQNSKIVKAVVEFTGYSPADGLDTDVQCHFENADDSSPPSDKVDLESRVLTTGVPWKNIEEWKDNYAYQTPQLRDILQGVINRAGWVSGNNILFTAKNDGLDSYRLWSAIEHRGGVERARLKVSWIAPKKLDPPVIMPVETFQLGTFECTIRAFPTDASIYYTIDGSNPNTYDILYTAPFQISSDTEVRARAYKDYWTYSDIASRDYTSLPVIQGRFIAITERYNPGDNAAISYWGSEEWSTFATGTQNQWQGIAWSPYLNKFVIVADDTRDPGGDLNRAAYSSDGIDWSTVNTPVRYGHSGQWKDVCWSPKLGMFLAVSAAISYCAMYSFDGITWIGSNGIPQPVGINTSLTESLDASETDIDVVDLSAFVLGFPIVIDDEIIDPYSKSGNTFTGCTRGAYGSTAVSHNSGTIVYQWVPPINNWRGVCWSEDLEIFVAVRRGNSGFTDSQVMISSDGVVWSGQTAAAYEDWRAVCWSPELGLFCAVAAGTTVGDRVMTSPDGENWTERAGVGNKEWSAICWSPELTLFVAVGFGAGVMTSPNGVDWTSRTVGQYLRSVCWSSEYGLFVAGGGLSNSSLQYSSDGIVWYNVSGDSISNANYTGVVWAPD